MRIKRIGRIGVSVAAVILLAALLTSLNPTRTTVDAASLKHIDEIVAASGTFNVLEIVPDTTAASFGYYIDGQEPIAAWKTTLAGLTSPSARSSYANTLFSRLATKGVLSNKAATPLTYNYFDGTNYYTEAYTVTDPQNWLPLHLSASESSQVTGTMTPAANSAYIANYTYAQATGGGYIQNISYFNYSKTPVYGQGTYFYNPVFTAITAGTDLTGWDNVVLYTKDASGNYSVDTADKKITVKDYSDSGGLDAAQTYYYVNPAQTGAPGNFNYAAVVSMTDSDDAPHDGYTTPAPSNPSYFSRSISSYTYVGTGGNYSYSNTGSTVYTVNYTDIFYKGGYVNNNLFKTQVFGLDSTDMNAINVTVTVRKASDVTSADISAASMIYISSGTDITQSGVTMTYTAANDIPDAQAVNIYNYAANLNPVIIDYSIIKGVTQTPPPPTLNIQKLCLLSLQSITTNPPGIQPTTQTSLAAMNINWTTVWTNLSYMAGTPGDTDRTFVNNNVYCFNAFNDHTLGGQANITYLVSSLFNDSFDQHVYQDGFASVLTDIQNENFLRTIAGERNLLPENVTVSASVRQIINYKGQRQTNQKTSITVLDLEPAKVTSATWLTANTVQSWINNTLTTNQINIVHMTTGEFNGKIEDLNETYDMVYLGMSTESLNTVSGNTVFNDASMNGLIYSNIGDKYTATIEMAGIRSQDYVTVNGTKAINDTTGTNANLFRFSGNDITNSKVTALQKFAQAGYPVVLADGFVSGSSINTAKVDNSSYMYQAVSSLYGPDANVMTQTFAGTAANSGTVIKYLNVSKPALTIPVKPADYAANSNATLTVNPNDGYYYLNYTFSIGNVTDPTPLTTTYNCMLYIDLNADGIYAANEELNDIEIHRVSDGALILPTTDSSGNEDFALTADTQYQVTRQMPDSYVGIIPWKLEVVKNGADQIHTSQQGYTRIAAGTTGQPIKVLQIMQAGTSGTKLNLSQQLTVNSSGSNSQLKGLNGKYYNGIYGKLIADLQDFNVSIDEVDNNVLEAKGTSATILSYLNGYDMLIIGFNDCYDGISSNSAAAIVSYINSGKSVLFTHDTTSLTQVPSGTQMATSGGLPNTYSLGNTNIVWNSTNSIYQSVDGNVYWYDSSHTTSPLPPYLKQNTPTYLVYVTAAGTSESDYFGKRASIYNINTNTQDTNTYTSLSDFNTKNSNPTIIYVLCTGTGSSNYVTKTATETDTKTDTTKTTTNTGHGSKPYQTVTHTVITTTVITTTTVTNTINATSTFVKYINGTKYYCNGMTFSDSPAATVNTSTAPSTYSYPADTTSTSSSGTVGVTNSSNTVPTYASNSVTTPITNAMYPYIETCLNDSTTPTNNYAIVGTYNGSTYAIGGTTYYPATGAAFPQSTLYVSDPAHSMTLTSFPNSITDWGYYFNTIIRDTVGLDKYGVSNSALKSIVDVSASMPSQDIATVLNNSRSVAFKPNSAKSLTVPEFQGYTNYALMRFGGTNTYKYTNNTYTDRETTNVSQVNKGQITTYPYNVNTANFGGTDSSILNTGGSYMQIGLTHEQYFQINMNTNDIVVWYCLSNYGSYNSSTKVMTPDDSSYYDDVPNDCVNAYYIYNKGNVTYSGVGHTSDDSLYTGSNIGQQYINEAKLFVNTMIAAYQSGIQAPAVKIKSDALGTNDLAQKYMVTDEGNFAQSGGSTVLSESLGKTDDSRAVYYRISDPNIGVAKTISVNYYIADNVNGTIDPTVDSTQKCRTTIHLGQ